MVDKKLEVKENIIAGIVILIMTVVLPMLGLFFFGGIESSEFFNKSLFYYIVGTISFLILSLLSVGEYFGWLWSRSLIHDPENGLLKDTSIAKYLTPGLVFNISFILFSLIGISAVLTNTVFVAIPGTTEFQVQPTGELILATEPAASAETLLFVCLISIMWGYGNYYIKQKRMDSSTRYLLAIGIVLITILAWVALHFARYGSAETDLAGVAIFAAGGALVTLLSGSIIPWYVWHFLNNLFVKANSMFSNEGIIATTFIVLTIYYSIFFWIYLTKRKGGKN